MQVSLQILEKRYILSSTNTKELEMPDTESINICPSWAALIPLLVEVAANGNSSEGRKSAMDELVRLATIVDEQNKTANQELAELKFVQGVLVSAFQAHGDNQFAEAAALMTKHTGIEA
jgi:hypothetical protein